uniref:C-type lectin domain-containing protein n=1 Tax=Podarcis muralis TaxID=64176 RepID=A0A670J434_PODMU
MEKHQHSTFKLQSKAACPNGWLQNQGNCYAYIEKMMTWADAEVDCQSYGRGVHLASILNQKECSIVAKYILAQQKTRTDVWIGLYDPLQVSCFHIACS